MREPEPDRLDALERDLRELRDEVAALRAELASERGRPLQEQIAAVPAEASARTASTRPDARSRVRASTTAIGSRSGNAGSRKRDFEW